MLRTHKSIPGRILLTGASGFIGSRLAAGLWQRGYSLVLPGRKKGGASAHERIWRQLRFWGIEEKSPAIK